MDNERHALNNKAFDEVYSKSALTRFLINKDNLRSTEMVGLKPFIYQPPQIALWEWLPILIGVVASASLTFYLLIKLFDFVRVIW